MAALLKPEVSPETARTFLTGRLSRQITGLVPLSGGEWSQAFAFSSAGQEFVARFSHVEEDFAKDRIAVRFASPQLPVPRIVEIGEALGGYFAISQRVFGVPLDSLSEAEMRAVLPSLLETLDAIRLVGLSGSTGYGVWRADGGAPSTSWSDWLLAAGADRPGGRISGWRAKLEASPYAAAFDEALACLRSTAGACPNERHLVHADLLNNNVLVSGDRVTAVLDWGSSLYGDFLYDVAWLIFCQFWYPAWETIDFAGEASRHYDAIGLGVPNFAERLRCYELHIGVQSQVYNAFRERWGLVAQVAERTLALARTE